MVGRSNESEKRPWLAALLGTLATGLGHVYLRRWKRGVGWFVAAIAVSAAVVPPEAAQALLDGSGADLGALAPVLAVGVASVADAYVLARLRQRGAGDRPTPDAGGSDNVDAGSDPTAEAGAECPSCGKELDSDLDFCPWCTARLSDERET